MKRWLAAALAAVALQAAAGWRQFDSEHFSTYSEGSELAARDRLQQLETLRWLALKLMRADEQSVRAQSRFEIVVLPGKVTLQSLLPDMPPNTEGVYAVCGEGAVAWAIDREVSRGAELPWGQMVQQHELAHHLMAQYATMQYPSWFVEGFAEYLGTTRMSGENLLVGDLNRWRSFALERGNWLPFADVLAWRLGGLAKRPPSEVEYFYGQSWLLTHYLLGDEARAAGMARYFERIAAGDDPVAAFEPATGIPVAELESRLQRYLPGLQRLQLRGADLPKATVRAETLTADAGAVLTDRMLLRSCTGTSQRAERLARLRAAAAAPGAGAATRRTAARAELLADDPRAALALLEPLLAADDADAEANYLAGRSWALRAAALDGSARNEALDRARAHLFKAYRANKGDGPTLYHLARVLEQTRGPTDPNTLNAARAARVMLPAVPEVAVFAARLEVRAGDRERAARALGTLAGDPHHPEQAARMRRAVEAIRAGRPLAEIDAAMNPEPTPKP